MIIRLFILSLIIFAAVGVTFSAESEIKVECGGSARVVWCQDAGAGTDAGAEGRNLRLMGFDTDDGKGERCILAELSNYAKPMLTPDGRKVIFSNRLERKIFIVDFDGSGLKQLASGLALAVWRDSLTETDWVYAGTEINLADAVISDVRRFRLDRPEVNEPVWNRTTLNIDNFQLSADGRNACGTFPWPVCGIAALPDGGLKKYGDGCWPSLSPDNNLLMWIFDGAHRNLTMVKARTEERWVVNINNAPGIDSYEVYHPRWSSHPLFMVMTGPYKIGDSSNRIRGGGRGVEIYLGRFAADYKKIEKWIQVTHNQYADFFPDMWIAEGRDGSSSLRSSELCSGGVGPSRPKPGCLGEASLPGGIITGDKSKTETGGVTGAWPISFDKIVFYWQNRSKANSFTDPADGRLIVCRADARGRARYGRNFEMMPAGGAFIADGGAETLIDKCAASRQLGIEVLITPEGCNSGIAGDGAGTSSSRFSRPEVRPSPTKTEALLPIIGYAAKNGAWNFLLGQKGDRLMFRLRSEKEESDYKLELGAMPLDQPSHVIVSCSASSLVCYLNGEQIFSAESIYGGNWTSASSVESKPGAIVFGNELLPDYPVESDGLNAGWKGMIENVAIYARWIGLEEARKKYSSSIAKIAGRKKIPGISVKATLISEPGVPAPASIAPYRRALMARHYRVAEVVEGKCQDKEIMVARWAILDGKIIAARFGNFQKVGPSRPHGESGQSGRKPGLGQELRRGEDGGTSDFAPSAAQRAMDGRQGATSDKGLSRPTSNDLNNLQKDPTVFMKLELFSDHPELEGERLIMDSDRYDLPLYYVVEGE